MKLAQLVQSGTTDGELLGQTSGELLSQLDGDLSNKNWALEKLAPLLEADNVFGAGFVALLCGAAVEGGGDPEIPAPTLLRGYKSVLDAARLFVEKCYELAGTEEALPSEVLEAHGLEVSQSYPKLAAAWSVAGFFGQAGIAIMTRSAPARAVAQNTPGLETSLQQAAGFIENADWCFTLVQVLDNEELVVLHPATEQGFRVRISGIPINFQLHTLLADALCGEDGFPYPKPSPLEVAVTKGDADADPSLQATGVFNMVNWPGVTGAQSDHWIWNEGVPKDILLFEGTRVILIEDAPYQRTWNAGRMFDSLRGEVQVLEKLSTAQVQDWLRRLEARA